MNGHAAAARTISVPRERATPAYLDFDLSALERHHLPSDWVTIRGWVSTKQLEVPFLAIRHDVASTTPSLRLADEDESKIPFRFVDSAGERYNGPHGKLVVMRRK